MKGREEKELVYRLLEKEYSVFYNLLNQQEITLHWHKHYEILYLEKGVVELILNGGAVLFREKEMILINAYESHSIKAFEESKFLVMQFKAEFLEEEYCKLFKMKYLVTFLNNINIKERIVKENSMFENDIMQIQEVLYKRPIAYEICIRASILKIIYNLIQEKIICIPDINRIDYKNLDIIMQAIDYVQNNLGNKIEEKEIAKVLGYNQSYFCKMFKEIMGQTFMEYVLYLRISEAEKSLISTEKNITEISLESGFNSLSYFNRAFKKKNNMSPINYRKAKNKNSSNISEMKASKWEGNIL
ncbi:AraC family transcriptional regulator [Cellulosilyticum sp. I15G10I2]|uniref:AraC family transcriptional regulator n=1 Tax=Cellulosilyticum sp. I15G10I2 TaxID=1892843 RepID=UPI00085C6037|nr:AraC family transcriptional regulator [Cellulosilyticum sp. I15G10I2]